MSVVLGRDDNSPELGITFPLSLFSPSICPTDFPSADLSPSLSLSPLYEGHAL